LITGSNTGKPMRCAEDAMATQLLRAGHHSSPHQAGLRVACELPPVDLVVAGTSDRDHLRQLAEAIRLPVNHKTIDGYTALLGRKLMNQPTASLACRTGEMWSFHGLP
jgi:hypothetical protein